MTGHIQANALHIPLAANSVHCVVTSPPYYGLRDYQIAGQLGLEPTPDAYIANMVQVFREVWRVLLADGTCFLNLGDSYNGTKQGNTNGTYANGVVNKAKMYATTDSFTKQQWNGAKPKDLLMIPARVALALQADGWYIRSEIVWHKPNPMPESVTDRPTKAHEMIYLLTKQARYFYDAEAVKEAASNDSGFAKQRAKGINTWDYGREGFEKHRIGGMSGKETYSNEPSRNRRSVWTVATSPYRQAHFATFPPKLIEPCILAGTSERGVCPQCGKQWVRVVETTGYTKQRGVAEGAIHKHLINQGGAGVTSALRTGLVATKETTGFRPACECNQDLLYGHEVRGERQGREYFDEDDIAAMREVEKTEGLKFAPIPATVLDPFGGSGTVGAVAKTYGRNAVLLDLNPQYIALQRERVGKAQTRLTA